MTRSKRIHTWLKITVVLLIIGVFALSALSFFFPKKRLSTEYSNGKETFTLEIINQGQVIEAEEKSFGRTLDRGLELFAAAAEKAAARNALIQSRMRKGSATLGAAGMMGMMIPQQKGTDGGAMATSALSAGGMGAMFGSMLPGQAGVIGSFVGAALGVTFGIWRKIDEAAKNASKAVLDMAVAFNKATAGFNQEALKALGAPDKDLPIQFFSREKLREVR